jgi:peptidoglycan/LPS O-acetylase OafA/YrhL
MEIKKYEYIDFFKAISILSVLFFHLGFLEGGYLGVDFFFVISGFLIFKVYSEKYKYQFNGIQNFLFSRFRRIIPALYVSISVSIVLFISILSANELRDFGQSIISSILFLSNFLFWRESGYYEPISELKPLLHTWSLSVEMQFYFFIIFIFFIKLNFIYIIFFISLFFSHYKDNNFFQFYTGLQEYSVFSFYLISSRIWEFIIGIFTYLAIKRIKNFKFNYFLFYIVLIAIVICLFVYKKNLNHPGLITLIPVLLFAFFIFLTNYAYNNNFYLIKNKFLVFTGKISYSLYLYHFIFIVFYKHVFDENIHFYAAIFITFLTYFFSYFSYIYIEKKFYLDKKKTSKTISYLKLIYITLILNFIFSFLFHYNEKFNFNIFKAKQIKLLEEKYSNIYSTKRQLLTLISEYNNQNALYFDNLKNNKINSKSILILGDSHAGDLYLAFKNNNFLSNLNFFNYGFNCKRKLDYCDFSSNYIHIEQTNQFKDSNIIILSMMYDYYAVNEKTIKELKYFFEEKHKKKLIIANMSPVFYVGNSDPLTTFFIKKDIKELKPSTILEANLFSFSLIKPDVFTKNMKLEKISADLDLKLLDRFSTFCNIDLKQCKIISDDLKVYFFDHSHLAEAGYEFLGKNLFNKIDLFN